MNKVTVAPWGNRDLSRGFLHAFFEECSLAVKSATFEGCISPGDTSNVSRCYFTLKRLAWNARPERMFESFGGQGLYVEACLCFDDSIIDYLADTTEENFSCPSPKINMLSLADCDGFTFVSMMRLVEAESA